MPEQPNTSVSLVEAAIPVQASGSETGGEMTMRKQREESSLHVTCENKRDSERGMFIGQKTSAFGENIFGSH